MDAISFGEWLRRTRKSVGLTQSQLADMINCATITLRKIEAEERKPSPQIAEQLARVLEIPADEYKIFLEFARGDWHMTPTSDGENYPWRSSTTPNNLPASSMLAEPLGRDRDISSIKALLLDSNVRLVTLAGPPGVSKTHLSLAIAYIVLQQFSDGVFFIPFAPLKNENQIALTFLKILGVKKSKIKSPLDRLIDGIRSQQVLLILDNVDCLINAAGRLVFALLEACPGLKILATSREVFHLPGEQIYPVAPLQIPDETQLNSLDNNTLSEFSALAMFSEHARINQPGFLLTQDNILDVVKICQQLDGLPLAIELLATRLNVMTPKKLLSHLNDHFILNTAGPLSLPSHQKTLNQAIQLSYDLLSAPEKRLFAVLSVFAGGFTFSQVEEAFTGIFERDDLSNLITSLVDKCLLQIEPMELAEPRLSMLNTVRCFAAQRLAGGSDLPIACERHLRLYHHLAETACQEIHRQGQLKWVRWIEMEQDNLSNALEYSFAKENFIASISILTALGSLWFLKGDYASMASWFEKIKSLVPGSYHSKQYAALLNLLAKTKIFLGEIDQAHGLLKNSLGIASTMGEEGDPIIADALGLFGLVINASHGQVPKARFYIEQALALHQNNKDTHGMSMDFLYLACLMKHAGRLPLAVTMAENSLQLFEQLNDVWGKARCYQVLGQLYLESGQLTEASWSFNQQLEADTLLGFKRGQLAAMAALEASYLQDNETAPAGAVRVSSNFPNFDPEFNKTPLQFIPCFS